MNPDIYGTIIDMKKKGQFIFMLCEYCDVYSVVIHDIRYDLTDIVIRCSDCKYCESIIRNKIKELEMDGCE